MVYVHSFYCIAVSSFIATAGARIAPLHLHHQHEAIEVGKRQVGPPLMGPPPDLPAYTTDTNAVLMQITPSPGASAVAVTKQSQIVTSYVPQFTLCELPPLEFFSVSLPPVSESQTTALYQNYSISIPSGNGTCTTIFSPTPTMVCATTLTALVDRYTVTNCNQDLTFSTQYGYVLETPTPTSTPTLNATGSHGIYSNATAMITAAPAIETLTTYYLAPWQQLTAGTAPFEVDLKVCRTFTNGTVECIREYQVWSTSLLTLKSTSVTSINISTTIHGTSQVIVETFVANVTELLTTFSLSTTMDLEFQTEFTITHSKTRTRRTSTGPTVYETLTVKKASSTSMPAS